MHSERFFSRMRKTEDLTSEAIKEKREQEYEVELSIIIVSYNTKELTKRCLGHLKEVNLPSATEIIVVDNGSEDKTIEVLSREFSWVILIRNEINLGFAKAVNIGLRHCHGRYALLLNTDCFPKEDAVMYLLGFMEGHPKVGIVGGALLHPDGRLQNSFGRAPTLATELLPKGLLQWICPSRFPSKRRPPFGPVEVEAVVGAFMMVRRKAWEEVGLMDEGFFLFMEETDWCVRMKRQGWSVYHLPQAQALHLQGRSVSSQIALARVEFYKSRYRYFAIHRGPFAQRALKVGLTVKVIFNCAWSGLLHKLPIENKDRWLQRHFVDRKILSWHLKGCPSHWGMNSGESTER